MKPCNGDARAVVEVSEADAVDALVFLIVAAAGEAGSGAIAGGEPIRRCQLQEAGERASVQRQGIERPSVLRVADTRRFRLDQSDADAHLHGRLQRPEIQPDVDAPLVARHQLDILDNVLLEAGGTHPERVLPVAELPRMETLASSDCTAYLQLLSVCTASTLAFGIMAAVGSLTVPVMAANVVWADAHQVAANKTRHTKQHTSAQQIMIPYGSMNPIVNECMVMWRVVPQVGTEKGSVPARGTIGRLGASAPCPAAARLRTAASSAAGRSASGCLRPGRRGRRTAPA